MTLSAVGHAHTATGRDMTGRFMILLAGLLLAAPSVEANELSLPCPECAPEYAQLSSICFSPQPADKLAACSKILSLKLPKTIRAFVQWQRGTLLSARGRHKEALRDLSAAIQVLPNQAYLRNERAWALVRLGRPLEGLKNVEEVLRHFPEFHDVRDTRAHIRLAQGRPEEALADFMYAFEYGDGRIRRLYACGLRDAGILSTAGEDQRLDIVKGLAKCVQTRGCSPVPKILESCPN